MEQYTVEQHAALIGLTGKVLKEQLGEYGLDVFINVIVKYAGGRGRRMGKRAIRDGEPLNYETFLAYSELKIATLPTDYSVLSESPVYINQCHRCRWDEGWKEYGLGEFGAYYCKYVDLHLIQGFSPDLVMVVNSMLGCGDTVCTFVNVGYEQTQESRTRIANLREALNGRYTKSMAYHMGHWLNAARGIMTTVMGDAYATAEQKILDEFQGLFDQGLRDLVYQESLADFDAL